MDEVARNLIADHLGIPVQSIVETATFRSLGADSLDLVSLTMAFEEAFDLAISDDQAEACNTVRDAMVLLTQRMPGDRLRSHAPMASELVDAGG